MPDQNNIEPLRAINSGSNLLRRRLCPGSANAEIGFGNESSVYADEGRLLHHHDEHPEQSRDNLTSKQRGAIERNAGLRERFITAQREALQLGEPDKIFREREFFLCGEDGIPIEPLFPAHPDLIYYYRAEKVAFIFDSKFGRLPVPTADANLQLRSYAVCFAEEFDCERVFVAVTQPWLSAPDDFHAAEYTGESLPSFKRELLSIIAATKPENAPRIPSIEACHFCKAKADCREAQVIIHQVALAKVNTIPIPELEKMWPEARRARQVIDAIEERLKKIARECPAALSTLRLGDGQTIRCVDETADALNRLANEAGFDGLESELLNCASLSLTLIEECVARRTGMTAMDAKNRVETILGDLIERSEKSASLVKK